jgi:hypothetical protein
MVDRGDDDGNSMMAGVDLAWVFGPDEPSSAFLFLKMHLLCRSA